MVHLFNLPHTILLIMCSYQVGVVIVATPIGYVHMTNNINMGETTTHYFFSGAGVEDGMNVWPSDD